MKKAVMCTRCRYKYHQDLDPPTAAVIPCPRCGSAGRMIMGPGQAERVGSAFSGIFPRPKFMLPEMGLPVNVSWLEATRADIGLLHAAVVGSGFTCLGFHGCGSVSARNILLGVRDVSTTNARGRGFMVGSLYTGIPDTWAAQVKGGGTKTILRVYVRGWATMRVRVDFDWGKMDPDDKVSEEGLEMVLKVHTFGDVVCLPSIDASDQALVAPDIWRDCPAHNFRRDELPMVRAIATHMGISLAQLEEEIEEDGDKIAKIAKSLGFNV